MKTVVCSGMAYLLLWFAGRGTIPGYLVVIAFLFYLEGVGNSGMYFAAFSFTQEFPEKRRGLVMGILLASLGLVSFGCTFDKLEKNN